jgi:hypothetical protein
MEAKIPEEIEHLLGEIETTFHKKQYSYVLPGLWLILIRAIMAAQECSFSEALARARNFCDDAIAQRFD